MKDMTQKYRVSIELDLDKENFTVSVVNCNERKGYVDVSKLKDKLMEIFQYMQNEGMDELTSQAQNKNTN